MARKIPPDAFEFYFALGPGRSYQAVATKYGVTKRAVTDLAKREGWQARLQDLHKKAHQAASERALESLDAMNQRHLATLRAIQVRALDALKGVRLDSALAAVRALDMAIRQERAIRGDSGDGGGVEDVIRREYERWMVVPESDEAHGPAVQDADGPARRADVRLA